MKNFINDNTELMYELIKDICMIPAPSHHEEKRAEYCKSRLEEWGAVGVYIDEALNVIYPLNCEGNDNITVFAAHTDTVFPDTEPMPYSDDGEYIYSPGVGDNVASVAVLMTLAKYYTENDKKPKDGIMFVFNSCEEGLGNLKGMRKLFEEYDHRVSCFISFDSKLNIVHDRCVGSHRYLVEAETAGGHSYYDFGTPNAIGALSSVVNDIYKISVPDKIGTKTTYNVGTISGGTSVNTIAQSAEMLCEYRSDDKDSLAYMQRQFDDIFNADRGAGISIKVTQVGSRPCSDIDEGRVEALKAVVEPVIESVIGERVKYTSASTDCNIPMSLGVPSLCIGVSIYEGMHTREEKLLKKSVIEGLQIAIGVSEALTCER